MIPEQLPIKHSDESYTVPDLLKRRKQCLSEMSRTKKEVIIIQNPDALQAFLAGGRAALALIDRKIAAAKKAQRNYELMEAAKKMVLTTTNWYEQQNQIQAQEVKNQTHHQHL